MKNQHTLSSIQSDFALWRQNKISPRDRTPDVLKKRTVALLNDYSPGKITNTLGISHEMLKRWQKEFITTPSTDAIEFISLPVAQNEPHNGANRDVAALSLTQANGNQWSLQGELTPAQIDVFVRSFVTA